MRAAAAQAGCFTIALILEDFDCHALASDLAAPLELDRFFRIATSVTAALAALHRQGVVHKDIKPENIFLGSSPDGAVQAKLTGFGFATTLSREHQSPRSARGYRRNARLHGARADGPHEPLGRLP